MTYLLLTVGLFLTELLYFKIADRFNIIDKPNQRSSHKTITLRGGGIIFPLSLVAYFLFWGFQYAWFLAGLLIIAAISFADDITPQSKKIRILLHCLAVALLIHQAGIFELNIGWIMVAFVFIIGIINAFNFMDGINGITSGYGFVMLLGLWMLNRQIQFIDNDYLGCLAAGNLVFAFFNFRPKAKCFAGDVGSVSMAFALLFPLVMAILTTQTLIFILFFAVYGVDTVLTILHRIYKKENIFEAHRQHLFQYLANEKKWSHLSVSLLYMAVQCVISLGTIFLYTEAGTTAQWVFASVVIMILTSMHCWVKFSILGDIPKAAIAEGK